MVFFFILIFDMFFCCCCCFLYVLPWILLAPSHHLSFSLSFLLLQLPVSLTSSVPLTNFEYWTATVLTSHVSFVQDKDTA